MLALPETGFRRSAKKNNVDRIALGDWTEGCLLFHREELSQSNIVDFLGEQGICDNQDLANEIAGEAWLQARERSMALGGDTSIVFDTDKLRRVQTWDQDPARAFLVVLSLFALYPKWAAQVDDVGERSALFERLVKEAMHALFPAWDVMHAGWSPAGMMTFDEVAAELNVRLATGGSAVELARWTGRHTKDAGLDVAVLRPFNDNREGVPLLLVQCASGQDWVRKTAEPDTNLWKMILQSAVRPWRALAIPFTVDGDELRRRCSAIEGPLLDRYRILRAQTTDVDWLSPGLANELTEWVRPRLASLPTA